MTFADTKSVAILLTAVALASVHILAGRLRFLEGTPRSVWLSGAGGVSVAYVFVHILSDLAYEQEHFRSAASDWLGTVERHVWIIALFELVTFYGLERLIRSHSRRENVITDRVFWLHIGHSRSTTCCSAICSRAVKKQIP